MTVFSKLMSKFSSATSGNVAIIFALSIIPLMAAVGGAIDYARYSAAKTDLRATVDAAVLAGTKVYADTAGDVGKAVAAAQKYYIAQIQSKKYEFTKNAVVFALNDTKNGLKASGDVQMKTDILGIVGISSLTLLSPSNSNFAVAIAPGGTSAVEIALMIDTTGSMCANASGPCTGGSTEPKFSAVKAAATSLIDKIAPLNASKTIARISFVPFSTNVKVEPDGKAGPIMKALTNLDPTWNGTQKWCDNWVTTSPGKGGTSEHESSGGSGYCSHWTVQNVNWKLRPCVTDRAYNATSAIDVTDDTPKSNGNPANSNWIEGIEGSRMPQSWDSTDIAPTSGTGKPGDSPSESWNYEPNGACGETADSNQMMPLTSDMTALKNRVNGLQAIGATAGAMGTAMTWFTLSPNFSSVWGSSAAPASYSEVTAKKVRKIAVLMTDGGYNSYRSRKDQDVNFVSNAAKATCAGMKARGIEVFSVAFDFDSLNATEATAAQDTLTNCASDAQHFFKADANADLITAFETIGANIASSTPLLVQ